MKILIACEESQRVCIELRKLGHVAYSCDIQECSGGHPEWHIQQDVLKILNPRLIEDVDPQEKGIEFCTCDRQYHFVEKWDMIIAHPPCTYLTVSGNRWFNAEKYGDKAKQRYIDRDNAVKFFMRFINADCDKVAVENPIGYMNTFYRKPDQYIQPYQFGNPVSKKTCLWLKGLPNLIPTHIVEPERIYSSGKSYSGAAIYPIGSNGKILSWNDPETAKIRSKTFPGIAKAMAEQWAGQALDWSEENDL